jgi:hypothetical protein
MTNKSQYGFYDDDGNEIDPDLVPKPALCCTCALDDDESQAILCTLNRIDQRESGDFICFAYRKRDEME